MQKTHQFFIELSTLSTDVKCGDFRTEKGKVFKCYYGSNSWSVKNALNQVQGSLGKHSFLFVHGFAGARQGLMQRTVLAFEKLFLTDKENQTTAILHIIWESHKLNYGQSLKIINKSKYKLGALIDACAQNSPCRQADLLCHSLGNQFLLETVKAGFLPKGKLRHLILAAADMSMKDFVKYEADLSEIADKVLVLYHWQDRILALSRMRNRGIRLGQEQPNVMLTPNISYLNCTNMKIGHSLTAKLNKHTYFLASDEVRNNIHVFLKFRSTPNN